MRGKSGGLVWVKVEVWCCASGGLGWDESGCMV